MAMPVVFTGARTVIWQLDWELQVHQQFSQLTFSAWTVLLIAVVLVSRRLTVAIVVGVGPV